MPTLAPDLGPLPGIPPDASTPQHSDCTAVRPCNSLPNSPLRTWSKRSSKWIVDRFARIRSGLQTHSASGGAPIFSGDGPELAKQVRAASLQLSATSCRTRPRLVIRSRGLAFSSSTQRLSLRQPHGVYFRRGACMCSFASHVIAAQGHPPGAWEEWLSSRGTGRDPEPRSRSASRSRNTVPPRFDFVSHRSVES